MARKFVYQIEGLLTGKDAFEESAQTLKIQSLVQSFEESLTELLGAAPTSKSRFVVNHGGRKPGRAAASASESANGAEHVAHQAAHDKSESHHTHVS